MDWDEGLKTRFSAFYAAMMGRRDWLRDMGTGLGEGCTAIALEIWVNLEGKRQMVRTDWTGRASATGWEGYGGKKRVKTQDG